MADKFDIKKYTKKKKRKLSEVPQEDLSIGSGADLSDVYDVNDSSYAPDYDFFGKTKRKPKKKAPTESRTLPFTKDSKVDISSISSIPGPRYKHVPDEARKGMPARKVKKKTTSKSDKPRARTPLENTGTGRDDGWKPSKNDNTKMVIPDDYDAVDPHPKGKMPVAKPKKPYKGYSPVDPHPVRKKEKPYEGYSPVDPHPVRKKSVKAKPTTTSIRDEAITNLAKKKKTVTSVKSKPKSTRKTISKPKQSVAPVKKREEKVQMVNTTSGNPFAKNFGGWGQLLQKDKTTKSGKPITRSAYNKKLLDTGDKALTSKVAEAARAKVKQSRKKTPKPSSRKKKKGLGMDSALDLF